MQSIDSDRETPQGTPFSPAKSESPVKVSTPDGTTNEEPTI